MRPTLVYALTIVLAAVALTGDVASAAPRIGQFGNRQPPCYRPSDVSTPTSDAATPTPTDSFPSSSETASVSDTTSSIDDAATSTQTETPTIPTNTPSPSGFVRPPASGSINLPNHVSS